MPENKRLNWWRRFCLFCGRIEERHPDRVWLRLW